MLEWLQKQMNDEEIKDMLKDLFDSGWRHFLPEAIEDLVVIVKAHFAKSEKRQYIDSLRNRI